MERAAVAVLAEMRRGVPSLAAIAGTAPLLALLATCEQMAGSFGSCGCNGRTYLFAVTGVFSEALWLAAWGLALGAFSAVAFRWCNATLDDLAADLDRAMLRLQSVSARSLEGSGSRNSAPLL